MKFSFNTTPSNNNQPQPDCMVIGEEAQHITTLPSYDISLVGSNATESTDDAGK